MERLRLSRATIYRRVADGTLKCVKIGRRLRFYKRYLDRQLYSKRSDI
jgi:excisionase family DNA binding protein